MKIILFTGLGFLFLALGPIGLFLPLLPTTPFVLLSAACFSGSPRFRSRIMKIGFFREHMENYSKRNGLSKKTTAISLFFLWGMLLPSMLLLRRGWAFALLSAVGVAVSVHILWMARKKGNGECGG